MRELYTSEADTVALNNGGVPSRAIHRVIPAASRTRTLLEMATWVCRSGSPGAGVAVGERCCDQTVGVDLGDAVGSQPRQARFAFDERQCISDRLTVGGLDLLGHRQRGGDGPQRRHRFHRAERHVVTGNRD